MKTKCILVYIKERHVLGIVRRNWKNKKAPKLMPVSKVITEFQEEAFGKGELVPILCFTMRKRPKEVCGDDIHLITTKYHEEITIKSAQMIIDVETEVSALKESREALQKAIVNLQNQINELRNKLETHSSDEIIHNIALN